MDLDGIGDADVTEFSAVAEGVDGGSADAEPAGGFDLKELSSVGCVYKTLQRILFCAMAVTEDEEPAKRSKK